MTEPMSNERLHQAEQFLESLNAPLPEYWFRESIAASAGDEIEVLLIEVRRLRAENVVLRGLRGAEGDHGEA